MAELPSVDVLVLGVAMHNFGIPAALKLWINQIVRAVKTFNYTENGLVGLVTDKKAHVFVASEGLYDPGSRIGLCGALPARRIGIHQHYGHTVPVGRGPVAPLVSCAARSTGIVYSGLHLTAIRAKSR